MVPHLSYKLSLYYILSAYLVISPIAQTDLSYKPPSPLSLSLSLPTVASYLPNYLYLSYSWTYSGYILLRKLVCRVWDEQAGLTDRPVAYYHTLDGLHTRTIASERERWEIQSSRVVYSSLCRMDTPSAISIFHRARWLSCNPQLDSRSHGQLRSLQIGKMAAHPILILASIFNRRLFIVAAMGVTFISKVGRIYF